MGKSQQIKGKRGELEVVMLLKKYGFDARRGQVWNGEPDIVSDLPIHFEVKRHEDLKISEWFKQAENDSGWKYPTVVFRQSRKAWRVVIRACDLIALVTDKNIITADVLTEMRFEDFLLVLKEVDEHER